MSPIQFALMRPKDRSFEAYKEWFWAVVKSAGGDPADKDVSDEELSKDWQEFWSGADTEDEGDGEDEQVSESLPFPIIAKVRKPSRR